MVVKQDDSSCFRLAGPPAFGAPSAGCWLSSSRRRRSSLTASSHSGRPRIRRPGWGASSHPPLLLRSPRSKNEAASSRRWVGRVVGRGRRRTRSQPQLRVTGLLLYSRRSHVVVVQQSRQAATTPHKASISQPPRRDPAGSAPSFLFTTHERSWLPRTAARKIWFETRTTPVAMHATCSDLHTASH
jgi:hypothetical protein